MKHFNPILKKTCVAMGLCFCAAVSAAPVQVDFGTLAMTGNSAFRTVLAGAGIIPSSNSPLGAVQGSFVYDDATPGNNNNPAAVARTYNGAVDALSFSVDGWFSQTLAGIGNNGDIVVRRNSGSGANAGQVDSITVTVACSPELNNTDGPICVPSPGNFDYGFTDQVTGIEWGLDSFTLLLQETAPHSNALNNLALPSPSEWLSNRWTVERITLRFNPFGFDSEDEALANRNLTGTIDFMAVPEPGSLALMGVALLGVVAVSRRRREARA